MTLMWRKREFVAVTSVLLLLLIRAAHSEAYEWTSSPYSRYSGRLKINRGHNRVPSFNGPLADSLLSFGNANAPNNPTTSESPHQNIDYIISTPRQFPGQNSALNTPSAFLVKSSATVKPKINGPLLQKFSPYDRYDVQSENSASKETEAQKLSQSANAEPPYQAPYPLKSFVIESHVKEPVPPSISSMILTRVNQNSEIPISNGYSPVSNSWILSQPSQNILQVQSDTSAGTIIQNPQVNGVNDDVEHIESSDSNPIFGTVNINGTDIVSHSYLFLKNRNGPNPKPIYDEQAKNISETSMGHGGSNTDSNIKGSTVNQLDYSLYTSSSTPIPKLTSVKTDSFSTTDQVNSYGPTEEPPAAQASYLYLKEKYNFLKLPQQPPSAPQNTGLNDQSTGIPLVLPTSFLHLKEKYLNETKYFNTSSTILSGETNSSGEILDSSVVEAAEQSTLSSGSIVEASSTDSSVSQYFTSEATDVPAESDLFGMTSFTSDSYQTSEDGLLPTSDDMEFTQTMSSFESTDEIMESSFITTLSPVTDFPGLGTSISENDLELVTFHVTDPPSTTTGDVEMIPGYDTEYFGASGETGDIEPFKPTDLIPTPDDTDGTTETDSSTSTLASNYEMSYMDFESMNDTMYSAEETQNFASNDFGNSTIITAIAMSNEDDQSSGHEYEDISSTSRPLENNVYTSEVIQGPSTMPGISTFSFGDTTPISEDALINTEYFSGPSKSSTTPKNSYLPLKYQFLELLYSTSTSVSPMKDITTISTTESSTFGYQDTDFTDETTEDSSTTGTLSSEKISENTVATDPSFGAVMSTLISSLQTNQEGGSKEVYTTTQLPKASEVSMTNEFGPTQAISSSSMPSYITSDSETVSSNSHIAASASDSTSSVDSAASHSSSSPSQFASSASQSDSSESQSASSASQSGSSVSQSASSASQSASSASQSASSAPQSGSLASQSASSASQSDSSVSQSASSASQSASLASQSASSASQSSSSASQSASSASQSASSASQSASSASQSASSSSQFASSTSQSASSTSQSSSSASQAASQFASSASLAATSASQAGFSTSQSTFSTSAAAASQAAFSASQAASSASQSASSTSQSASSTSQSASSTSQSASSTSQSASSTSQSASSTSQSASSTSQSASSASQAASSTSQAASSASQVASSTSQAASSTSQTASSASQAASSASHAASSTSQAASSTSQAASSASQAASSASQGTSSASEAASSTSQAASSASQAAFSASQGTSSASEAASQAASSTSQAPSSPAVFAPPNPSSQTIQSAVNISPGIPPELQTAPTPQISPTDIESSFPSAIATSSYFQNSSESSLPSTIPLLPDFPSPAEVSSSSLPVSSFPQSYPQPQVADEETVSSGSASASHTVQSSTTSPQNSDAYFQESSTLNAVSSIQDSIAITGVTSAMFEENIEDVNASTQGGESSSGETFPVDSASNFVQTAGYISGVEPNTDMPIDFTEIDDNSSESHDIVGSSMVSTTTDSLMAVTAPVDSGVNSSEIDAPNDSSSINIFDMDGRPGNLMNESSYLHLKKKHQSLLESQSVLQNGTEDGLPEKIKNESSYIHLKKKHQSLLENQNVLQNATDAQLSDIASMSFLRLKQKHQSLLESLGAVEGEASDDQSESISSPTVPHLYLNEHTFPSSTTGSEPNDSTMAVQANRPEIDFTVSEVTRSDLTAGTVPIINRIEKRTTRQTSSTENISPVEEEYGVNLNGNENVPESISPFSLSSKSTNEKIIINNVMFPTTPAPMLITFSYLSGNNQYPFRESINDINMQSNLQSLLLQTQHTNGSPSKNIWRDNLGASDKASFYSGQYVPLRDKFLTGGLMTKGDFAISKTTENSIENGRFTPSLPSSNIISSDKIESLKIPLPIDSVLLTPKSTSFAWDEPPEGSVYLTPLDASSRTEEPEIGTPVTYLPLQENFGHLLQNLTSDAPVIDEDYFETTGDEFVSPPGLALDDLYLDESVDGIVQSLTDLPQPDYYYSTYYDLTSQPPGNSSEVETMLSDTDIIKEFVSDVSQFVSQNSVDTSYPTSDSQKDAIKTPNNIVSNVLVLDKSPFSELKLMYKSTTQKPTTLVNRIFSFGQQLTTAAPSSDSSLNNSPVSNYPNSDPMDPNFDILQQLSTIVKNAQDEENNQKDSEDTAGNGTDSNRPIQNPNYDPNAFFTAGAVTYINNTRRNQSSTEQTDNDLMLLMYQQHFAELEKQQNEQEEQFHHSNIDLKSNLEETTRPPGPTTPRPPGPTTTPRPLNLTALSEQLLGTPTAHPKASPLPVRSEEHDRECLDPTVRYSCASCGAMIMCIGTKAYLYVCDHPRETCHPDPNFGGGVCRATINPDCTCARGDAVKPDPYDYRAFINCFGTLEMSMGTCLEDEELHPLVEECSPKPEVPPCTTFGTFPNPNDCRWYFVCLWPSKENRFQQLDVRCPKGQLFSNVHRKCMQSEEMPGHDTCHGVDFRYLVPASSRAPYSLRENNVSSSEGENSTSFAESSELFTVTQRASVPSSTTAATTAVRITTTTTTTTTTPATTPTTMATTSSSRTYTCPIFVYFVVYWYPGIINMACTIN